MNNRSTVTIRPARESDYQALNLLYCAWQQHHHKILPDVFKPQKAKTFIKRGTYLNLLEDRDATIIVALAKQEIVGFVEVVFDDVTAGDDHHAIKRASVEYLFVTPKHRKKGIGRNLLDEAAKWAKKKGRAVLTASVYQTNEDAINLYLKTKFEPRVVRLDREL